MHTTFHSEPTEHNNPYHRNPYRQIAPPPPRKLHWLHIILVTSLIWLLVDIIAGSIAMTYVTPSKVVHVTATPEIVKVFVPKNGIAPPYQTGLGSQSPQLFTKSFSEALSYNDVGAIATVADTPALRKKINDDPNKAAFREVCHGGFGKCSNDWTTVSNQLTQDTMEFYVDPYTNMTEKPPYPDVSVAAKFFDGAPTYYIIGEYDNRGFTTPMQHYGRAVFVFTICCGGSGYGYILESIDLYQGLL